MITRNPSVEVLELLQYEMAFKFKLAEISSQSRNVTAIALVLITEYSQTCSVRIIGSLSNDDNNGNENDHSSSFNLHNVGEVSAN